VAVKIPQAKRKAFVKSIPSASPPILLSKEGIGFASTANWVVGRSWATHEKGVTISIKSSISLHKLFDHYYFR